MTSVAIAGAWLVVGLLLVPAPARGQEPPPADATPAGVRAPAPEGGVQPADAAAAAPYSVLVDRLKAGDRSVDFTRFRIAFTETPAYTGMMMAAYQALWRPLNGGNFAEAIAVAEKVLAQNFTEPNAHMVAAIAYLQTGQREQADLHRFIASGLLQSIASKGDGKTPETAYEVVDISEEYAFVRSLNLQPKGVGSSAPPDGPKIDSMTVVDPRTGTTSTIHFNFDRAWAAGYGRGGRGGQ